MSAEGLTLLLVAAHAAIVFVAAVVISARRAPAAAIAWILAIAFIPVVGIIWFLLVGAGRLPRARRDKQLEVKATGKDGAVKTFTVLTRIDTPNEVDYYQHGGILQFVLRSLGG